MRDRTRARIAEVKGKLATESDLTVVHRFNQGATDVPTELPLAVQELLAETDGFHVGWISVPSAKRQSAVQFYLDDPETMATISREGDRWYVVGTLHDFPFLIEQGEGSIWWFSDLGRESFLDSPFERLADDLDDFIVSYALGSGYRRIFGESADEWYAFLVRHGFASQRDSSHDRS
ncbi:hypothetical protein [Actinomadura gamaensis]|uniref:SUKH-4 immunity protein of toxin-antitoxin system n=1 Tax=Actinomadura gamaensis TaxID=1763541 RepID=A0ABV9U8G5_9ACTN